MKNNNIDNIEITDNKCNNDIKYKQLKVAIIGKPNSGKSTLINLLIGQKISIVTHKAQTTRFCTMGVLNFNKNNENFQFSIFDTPGIFIPHTKNAVEKKIVFNTLDILKKVKKKILLISSDDLKFFHYKNIKNEEIFEKEKFFQERFNEYCKNEYKYDLKLNMFDEDTIICVTKCDLMKKMLSETFVKFIEDFNEMVLTVTKKKPLFISSFNKNGINDLLDNLTLSATESISEEDSKYTDISEKILAEELTREEIFKLFKQEIPYVTHVETVKWEDIEEDDVVIYQNILVIKESQKGILLGNGGSMIRRIRERAVESIMEHLSKKRVKLYLQIKVKPNWADYI